MTVTPLIDLDDAKAQLEIDPADHADDTEILGFILTATEDINTACGVSVPTSFTESLTGNPDRYGRCAFVTTYVPLMSVQTVVGELYGNTITGSVVTHPDAGLFYSPIGAPVTGPQTVTYTAGRDAVPDGLSTACKLIVQWMWDSKRGADPLPPMGDDVYTSEQGGAGFPEAAAVAMRPYLLAPRL